MTIKTKHGTIVDISQWENQIRNNISKARDAFDGTPICRKADKSFWFWDEDKNPSLDKRSVKSALKFISESK